MTDGACSEVEPEVVILGAGINGAGLFRDLCEQGVPCLIVDRGDYGSGTSAAPSRLIHGGLKYLETGEFRLVAQSTLERNLLLRNAAHTVKPLPTVIPIFSWTHGIWPALRTLFGATSAPRSRGALLIKLGLSIYDAYGARHRVMPRHGLVGRARALRETPGLTPRIVAAGTYYDARIDRPERLIWELIADGMAANPRSAALNYTRAETTGDGALTLSRQGDVWTLRPRIVVNASGPWIDRVNADLGAPSRLIGGTRGSHILLRNDALVRSLAGRMIYFEADDGRICLVFDHLGLALVGSTDIPDADPDAATISFAEVTYLIGSVRALMPGIHVDADQIVYAYSGIRPLPASDATTPGLISRDHSAPVSEPAGARGYPIVSMVGGKWTTFRGFAEEVADGILARLGRQRIVDTRTLPIGGGRGWPADADARDDWVSRTAEESGLDRARVGELLDRYGTTASRIAGHAAASDADRLPGTTDVSLREIDWILRHEHVVHLDDLVKRRTTLAIAGGLAGADIDRIADHAVAVLGWPKDRKTAEVEALRRLLRERHMMPLPTAPT